jgi:hypothetical protein
MRPLHRLHLTLASLALAAVLALTNGRYDYHRDELYFRILDPAWGYADQPPLTPLLGHAAVALFGDTVWALRIPSVLCMVGVLWLAVLVTREFGGGKGAQALCAWGLAFAGVALAFGHTLSTATVDLLVWTAVLLFAVRALMRDERWWLAVGAVTGIGLYNKHLIVLLLLSLAVGLLVAGPRRALASKWLWAGVAIALVVGSPNLVYQAVNGWPQLEMASAINEEDGAENRVLLVPFQFLLVGLFLVPVWFAGIWALLKRPQWRPARALAVAYPVLLAVVLATGGQFYYPMGLVILFYAAGCAYTDQVEAAAEGLPEDAVIITSNYGEAGALERYGEDLPPVYSGHNALAEYGPPPAGAETVLAVGMDAAELGVHFDDCAVAGELDNGVGVDNEEQGRSVVVCRGPALPWTELWEEFRHFC